MPTPAFTPAAAMPIKGRFNPAPLVVNHDKLLKGLSPQRGAAGPQFYPMMKRQREDLLSLATHEAHEFMRHQDPSLLPPIIELQANAGRAIGYDPDIVIAAGTEIVAANGGMFRPDTSLNVSAHAMQLWQVARLVPNINYQGVMEVDDIDLMPKAESLRLILKNQGHAGKSPQYELAAIMPAATLPDAITLQEEFASTAALDANKPIIPQPAHAGDTAFRLMTAWMIEEMTNSRPSRKFENQSGASPYMRVVPLFPNLSLQRVKHPATLHKLMGASLRIS